MAMQTAPSGNVDRHATTPFHLKLFYRVGAFHRLEEFPFNSSGTLPPQYVDIYTWPSCTLRELSHLLISALPPNSLPDPAIGTRLSYRLIFPNTHNIGRPGATRYISKELGNMIVGGDELGIFSAEDDGAGGATSARAVAGELNAEADKTLQEARFVIGDYVSCVMFPPLPNGSLAPLPGLTGRHAGGGGRVMGDFGAGGIGGGSRGGPLGGPRENGYGGFRGRGLRGGGAFTGGRFGEGGLPNGEWRRGESLPDGPGGRGYGRGRGRGY